MIRSVRFSLLLVLFWLLATPALARQELVVDLYLNTQHKGQYFGFLDDNGREFLLSEEDLNELGLTNGRNRILIDSCAYIPLSSLQPKVNWDFREKEIALYLTAVPELFGKTRIDLQRSAPDDLVMLNGNSAFLNYSLNLQADEEWGYENLSLPFEIGVRWLDLLFFTNWTYLDTDGQDELTRSFSYAIKDDTRHLRRYTFGDFNAYSGELGGGSAMAGIRLTKNFGLDPYFIRSPGVDLQLQLQTPADVEIWRNGSLIETRQLGPGEFEFLNLPTETGAGEAEVIIRDAFGRERRISQRFYYSATQLKEGLHEYNYGLGVQRENLGSENFSYNKPALTFQHRYGFSRRFTAGIRGELAEKLYNGGVSAVYSSPRWGAFSLTGALSENDAWSGHAAAFGYSFSTQKRFSGNLSYRLKSKRYSNLSLDTEDDRARSELLATASLSLHPYGSLRCSYSRIDNYVGDDSERVTLSYNKQLTRKLNMNLSATKNYAASDDQEIFLSLNYRFGGNITAYSSYTRNEDQQSSVLTLRRTPENQRGTDIRLQTQHSKPDQGKSSNRHEAELTYYSRYGDISSRVLASDDSENYRFRVTGGLGLINHSMHLGRRIYDGFAVVKVGDIEGVEVSSSNRPIGTTDKQGEIMVTGLLSNYSNKLSFKGDDLPLEYRYNTTAKNISVPYRGGAFVTFDISRFQSIIGRLYVKEQGKSQAAEFWELKVERPGGAMTSLVGRGGDFYLESLNPGNYPVTLRDGNKQCHLNLKVPQSDETLLDLGELICVMD